MRLLNGFKRLIQSKGHGVHSPFAYKLITQVFHSPHSFYAFFDIPEKLRAYGVNPKTVTSFNHLSFRLVHHFKAKNVLEVNPRTGINTLFLMTISTRVNCTWMGKNGIGETCKSILSLLPRQPRRMAVPPVAGDELLPFSRGQYVPKERLFVPNQEMPSIVEGLFDAIFVNCSSGYLPPIDQLLKLSGDHTFWVIHPITEKPGKQYWKQIVHDTRINVTFDAKETGTVFPWDTLTPSHYFV